MLEKAFESPLDCKEIQLVHPKGNQSWIFIGKTDSEAETSILWPPDVKSQLTGKDSDAGKEERQEMKEVTESEMVGWHQQLDGWVWASSGRWWRTGKSGMLQCMGSQRVRHNRVAEKQQHKMVIFSKNCFYGSCLLDKHGIFPNYTRNTVETL